MRKLNIWLVVAFVARFAASFLVWHPDLNNHADWGIRFWEYGPAKFYSANVWSFTWPNQPPGTMYMFAGIRKLYEGAFQLLSYLHFQLSAFPGSWLLYLEQNMYPAFLKLPAIAADLGIALLVYSFVKKILGKQKPAFWAAVVWLVNPVVWFNSTIWGQYDSVINFFALLAFYLLYKKKLALAIFVFAVSLYIKASLLIFAPIFVILAIRQKYVLIDWVKGILGTLLVIGLITLPFSRGEPFGWLLNLYKDRVFIDQLHSISANAFNLWGLVNGIHAAPQLFPESSHFFGWTYQYWSYVLFAIFYLPTLYLVYKRQDMKSVVWALAIAAFSSFMLLTNMHERYLYPLFAYFTILLFVYRNLFANYIGVSLIALINLYNFWWVPLLPGIEDFLSASGRLAPRILSGLNFMFFIFLYFRFVKYNFFKKRL